MNQQRRIASHPIFGPLPDRNNINFFFNGENINALEGDTIASALLANGIRTLRVHEETGTPRGIYCNIGHCFECRVSVNGIYGLRSCLTPVANGMNVEGGKILPSPLKKKGDYTNV
jgi:sarcosine oxidase, subunit alpha